jgi:nickel superoxide dismutase
MRQLFLKGGKMNREKKKKIMVAVTLLLAAFFSSIVYSHCQIPCGIYDDPARCEMIAENITTIEKSMNQISRLSQEDKPDMNQIVRWVANKEKHADELTHTVTYYFMSQRIKPVDPSKSKSYDEYIKKLTLLHEMLVYSMKARQTTDITNIEKLKSLLSKFQTEYFNEN